MTPEQRQDLEKWADTGQITARMEKRFLDHGLLDRDEYDSLRLTTHGLTMLHTIKRGTP